MLTAHQKKVLAALLALEKAHGWRWWSRGAIGAVVGAGGFHIVIQRRTILALADAGLVMLERESWPEQLQQLVLCNCGCYTWGLTEAGRQAAEEIRVNWPPDAQFRIADAKYANPYLLGQAPQGDRFKPPDDFDLGDDDNDDDPSPSPAPRPPAPAFA